MIVVTGGAGFIGSNLVRALNDSGRTDLLVVDRLDDSGRFLNLRDTTIADYMDREEFRRAVESDTLTTEIEAIYHQGACSDTMEKDGRYMMENNYSYSKSVLHFALRRKIPLVYASSAAVYGDSVQFDEAPRNERPLNVYGFSKLAFDQHVRHILPHVNSTVVGLRYFNVYGTNEQSKRRMASCVHQFNQCLRSEGVIRMFEGSGGYEAGEQRRDFVYVGDVVRVNLFFGTGPTRKGIFNVGTGKSRSFNDIGRTLIQEYGQGRIEYVSFPDGLREKYQSFTQADLTRLRQAGFRDEFASLEDGIHATIAPSASQESAPTAVLLDQ